MNAPIEFLRRVFSWPPHQSDRNDRCLHKTLLVQVLARHPEVFQLLGGENDSRETCPSKTGGGGGGTKPPHVVVLACFGILVKGPSKMVVDLGRGATNMKLSS